MQFLLEAVDCRGGRLPSKEFEGPQVEISALHLIHNPSIYKVSAYRLFGDEYRHMQTWSRPVNCPYPSHSACDVLTDLGYRNIKDADDASNMGQG